MKENVQFRFNKYKKKNKKKKKKSYSYLSEAGTRNRIIGNKYSKTTNKLISVWIYFETVY